MIPIMARENMQEWDSSTGVEEETVLAVVEAYGGDRVGLPNVPIGARKDGLRYTPRFSCGDDRDARHEHSSKTETGAHECLHQIGRQGPIVSST